MKKSFVPFLILLIILTVTSFVLNEYYTDNSRFNPAAACFFVSIFFLFFAKNADKPKKDGFGPRNNIKQYFEAKGMLKQYSNLCNWAFAIVGIWGLVELLLGLVGI